MHSVQIKFSTKITHESHDFKFIDQKLVKINKL